MYSIYKTDGKIPYIKYTSFNNLNILRLDLTEQDLYNYRNHTDDTDKFNTDRIQNSRLKKIGFISRDFTENRPSGQLSVLFFDILSK